MSFDQTALVAVLAATLVLFISEKVRYDLAALGALLTCVLLGIVEPGAAFSGFANEIIIILASIFVLSGALMKGGVLDHLSEVFHRLAGGSRRWGFTS